MENKTSMYFYVSWYPGDPQYSYYDADCSILISISSVAGNWTINRLSRLPKRLLIDSGGFRFVLAPQEAMSPRHIFERQLALLGDRSIPTIVCARDFPILEKSINSKEKDRRITQTIAFAYELKNLIEQRHTPKTITPMAIIQGNDIDSLIYCAQELQTIEFPLYGLGSLAELRNHELIMKRIQAVADVLGPEKLHIFGIGAVKTIWALREMGIHSFDSSRPAKAAAYNEILYSRPYRRFGILEPDGIPLKGQIPRHRRLETPLLCNCPACIENPTQIMIVGKRANIRSRALHNYYHLKRIYQDPSHGVIYSADAVA